MVTVGDAFTLAPVVALRPLEGLHAYVDAPEAASASAEEPLQNKAEPGVTLTTGKGRTVAATSAELTEPPPFEQVTTQT